MALTVAVMAAEEKWGVIAVGPSKEWRISFGYPNYSTALYWARYFIRGGREVLAFRDCGALVQNDTGLSAASGATLSDAEGTALADLDGSWIVTSACNAGPPGTFQGP